MADGSAAVEAALPLGARRGNAHRGVSRGIADAVARY